MDIRQKAHELGEQSAKDNPEQTLSEALNDDCPFQTLKLRTYFTTGWKTEKGNQNAKFCE